MPQFSACRLDYEKCCCLVLLAAVIVDKMLIGIGRLLTRPNRLDWQGMRVRVGGARSALRYLGVSNGNIFHMIYSILVWYIFWQMFPVGLDWQKRLSGGWGDVRGTAKSPLKYQEAKVFSLSWNLMNIEPTFKWEKILYQDTIYLQLMSFGKILMP